MLEILRGHVQQTPLGNDHEAVVDYFPKLSPEELENGVRQSRFPVSPNVVIDCRAVEEFLTALRAGVGAGREYKWPAPTDQGEVVRFYDGRELICKIARYREGSSKPQPSNPQSVSKVRLIGESSGVTEIDDAVDDLIRLIESTVDTDNWRDNGASIGSIHEIAGLLVISQRPETHEKLAKLLEELRGTGKLETSVRY